MSTGVTAPAMAAKIWPEVPVETPPPTSRHYASPPRLPSGTEAHRGNRDCKHARQRLDVHIDPPGLPLIHESVSMFGGRGYATTAEVRPGAGKELPFSASA